MRLPRVIVALLAGVALALSAAGPASAIRGGTEAARPYSFAGSLQRPESPRADGHVCGVTLIAPRWALTAGHCARNPSGAQVGTPRNWTVRIGSLDVRSGGQVARVEKFYSYSSRPVADGDIALLRLDRPIAAVPAALPRTRPAAHTVARIIGWGVTCDEPQPQCYPTRLREADTRFQATELCDPSGIVKERELCVGSPDGKVAATNMDSGGPALVRSARGWIIAGTVSGSNGDDQPVVYTDVSYFRKWITGIVSGSDVPADSPVPDLEGAVTVNGCSASVVRTASSAPTDPALLLTNGHCLEQRPVPGGAVVDQPDDQIVRIGDHQGYPQDSARTTRLLYATMTGTDVALYRLDKSYAQLRAKIFLLGTKPAAAGDRIEIISAGEGNRYSCTVDTVVAHLREDGYQQDDAYRYDPACDPGHGSSGSPLVLADGTTVVGVHSTGNDSGERCTENNPCEVAADGTVRVEQGRRYGQRTTTLPACLTVGSRLDLSAPGCGLTPPA
ncbi:trypsin-like serine protease [Actinoplanes sp. NPDC048796]|uniref:trypsin-like serine protease n=1 Tax=Actinoplanes sp. NPDC048796 TaxID=3155640 RepID=UPI0033FAF60B